MFQTNSYTTENWISKGVGFGGITLGLVISKKYCRTEIYFNIGTKDENKRIFDIFYAKKDEIEKEFGGNLVWERMDDKVTCRIRNEIELNCYDSEKWNEAFKFLVDSSISMDRSIKSVVALISKSNKK